MVIGTSISSDVTPVEAHTHAVQRCKAGTSSHDGGHVQFSSDLCDSIQGSEGPVSRHADVVCRRLWVEGIFELVA